MENDNKLLASGLKTETEKQGIMNEALGKSHEIIATCEREMQLLQSELYTLKSEKEHNIAAVDENKTLHERILEKEKEFQETKDRLDILEKDLTTERKVSKELQENHEKIVSSLNEQLDNLQD